jgi:hypothetical protein
MRLYGVDAHARSVRQRRRLENHGMKAASSGVRPASAQDAAECLAIYRPYVPEHSDQLGNRRPDRW